MTFKEKARELGIELNEDQIRSFDIFYEMLVEKNKVMNLTAVTEYEMVVDKHFIDSLSIIKCVNMSEIDSMIDIGTGAGFPSIPLKIVFPHIRMTLLDSLNKRLGFLNEVITELMFDNIQTLHARAEDAAHSQACRQQYDLAVSRAVADLSVLTEYTLPFVKIGGLFAAYKGADAKEETDRAKKAVRVMGGKIENVYSFSLPGSSLERSMICIRKCRNTPGKYPRKAGMPGKSPII